MADPLASIPDDLIDLSLVARRIGRRSDTLRAMSLRGEFPPVTSVGNRAWRVSAAAVARWYASRSTRVRGAAESSRLRSPLDGD